MLHYSNLLEQYTQLVQLKGYKTGGGKMYIKAVKEYFSFLKQRGYATFQTNGEDLAEYYQHLTTRTNRRTGGTLADNTINHHLFAIKVLFDYLLQSNLIEALPIVPQYLRNHHEPLEILTVDEIKMLYEATENKLETALLSVTYGCGLRRSELANLQLTDINLQKGNLIVRKGKGAKRREIPLSDKVIEDLKSYIHEERSIKHLKIYHLFINKRGNPMSGYTMNEIIKSMAERIPQLQNKTITLHTFRRSIATHLIENGAGIHFVKDFLGHSEIDTSQLYIIRRRQRLF